jgi:AbrB family looped-hinge helix DNA binding protein
MRTTIDGAGRVVIPKAMRDRLGLTGGQAVDVSEREGRIEIEPAPTPMTLVGDEDGVVAVPEKPLPPLTDDIVRATIEQTRR